MIILHHHQYDIVGIDDFAHGDADLLNYPTVRTVEVPPHLHRLDHCYKITGIYLVAHLYFERKHQTGHA